LDYLPLPTMPYNERPADLPLDAEECRTALHLAEGNVTEAAYILKVAPIRLRAFVSKSAYLQREVKEYSEQLKDLAVKVVRAELSDPDKRGSMARFVLTNLGGDRGYGGKSAQVTPAGNNSFTIEWGDEPAQANSNTIDGDYTRVG